MTINYHKRGRGRPSSSEKEISLKQVKGAEIYIGSSVDRGSDFARKKRDAILRGGQGSLSCPIDIMRANRNLSDGEAEALRKYKVSWILAYGDPVKYHGNTWVSMISGYGFQESPEEDVDKKIARVERYEEADSILKSCGPEPRNCIRLLCQGITPIYLQNQIQRSVYSHRLVRSHSSVSEKIEKIKSQSRISQEDYRMMDSLVSRKRKLEKQIRNITDSDAGFHEPLFDVWARDQFKIALRALMSYFKIEEKK